jgi:hypothetical protein
MVAESGGEVAKDIAVLDVYRRYRQFKPRGIAELNDGGLQLSRALAEELAVVVDDLIAPEITHQGNDEPLKGTQ